jgi:ribosomal protein L9
MSAPRLRSLLLRLRHAAVLHPQQPCPLPAFASAINDGPPPLLLLPSHQQQQTRAKRTVRVVLKRADPVTGGRAGDVVRVPAGRQRLDLFPAGAADYATPRVLREARAQRQQQAEAAAAAAGGAANEQQHEGGRTAAGAGDDDDQGDERSLGQALEVLESKAVVLRRRGKATVAALAAAADGGGGGGGDEAGGSSGGSTAAVIGRVTRADVSRAVERQLGVALDARLLLMADEGIRAFGEYRVPLNVAAPPAGGGAAGGGARAAAGAGGGGQRRQAHVRVEVVRTWR